MSGIQENVSSNAPVARGQPTGSLVVGIGASAGGIAALRELFRRVPTVSGLTFVVILHISAEHESNLAGIVQNETSLPVMQVNETVLIEPNRIYVNPPGKYLVMEKGLIRLAEPERLRGAHTSVDLFLRTLADAYQRNGVAVVLSGSGSDGTVGLRRIKEQGGFAIVQDPDEAEYDGMPRSAIETGLVDLILPVAEIPEKLCALAATAIRLPILADESDFVAEEDSQTISEILALVRRRTGHDFRQYKRPTLLRRITRRLQILGLGDIESYLSFLRSHLEETDALLRDLLITVTNFFRDRDAFEALGREVIPKLFEGKGSDDKVRVWVVGCATGEEAYSIAIQLSEYAASLLDPPRIQIFATDIDEVAIVQARQCHYRDGIALDVSADRLRHFFFHDAQGYQVKKELRDSVLFASHNVLHDPPFAKLDLISCRNLLMYLESGTQEKALGFFHFALKPGASLFLGASESADSLPTLFSPAIKKHRIYSRNDVAAGTGGAAAFATDHWNRQAAFTSDVARVVTYGQIHQRIVEEFAPPSVLVDEQYEIVHVSERASRYLRFIGGEPTRNLLKVINPGLLLDLRGLLLEVETLEPNDPRATKSRRIQFEYEGQKSIVDLTVRRVRHGGAAPGYLLIVFDEVNDTLEIDASEPESPSQTGLQIVEQLDEELRQTRAQLRLSIEQHEASTEELRASNEELKAINEELHSTAQELETSEEVLKSVNEELITVNHELRERIEEHSLTDNDFQNLIDSTEIATIFLDRDLHIRRYTPRVQELFNIMPTDLGRPLDHFTHKLNYDLFAQDAENVLRTMQNSEREVRSSDGRWYRARLLTCRTLENDVDGVVIDFVDVTERKNAEELRREAAALRQHSRIMTLAPVFIRDIDSRITQWSADCERLFGYTSVEAIGRHADDLLSTQLPAPLELIHRELFSNGSWQGELIRTTSSGELVTVASRWIVYHNEAGDPAAILEANHDIGANKRAEVELRETNRQKDEFLATLSHELRNPLAAILNGMQLLQSADEKEVVRSVQGVMKRQFSHLLCLVDDLLDLERLRYGKIILRKERINLAGLIESALETAHAVVKAHCHELTVSIDPQPLYVFGDSIRLAQVIVNLLHNAARYTLPGGSISITLASQGSDALISVRDNGMGIKPENLPHIFDLYVQAEPSSVSGRRGLGVGLSLAQKLVQLHDGRIEATSGGLGLGSKFDVYMPLIPPDRRDIVLDLNRTNGAAGSGSPRRVLIIDDDPDVADSLATLFTMSNHHAWTAYTGLRGIEAALEHLPDVVLIDIVMPDMDGYEVGRHLRERLPDALLIAVSGLAQESDQARSRDAGFDHHVTKPVTFRELEQLIEPLH